MMIEELGSSNGVSVIQQSENQIGGSGKINVKNNLSILRNRSTSPTIIPKKNLVRAKDNIIVWLLINITLIQNKNNFLKLKRRASFSYIR